MDANPWWIVMLLAAAGAGVLAVAAIVWGVVRLIEAVWEGPMKHGAKGSGRGVREPMGLVWEEVRTEIRAADGGSREGVYTFTLRARVPGGWLVWTTVREGAGLTFYPDPEHKWDVRS